MFISALWMLSWFSVMSPSLGDDQSYDPYDVYNYWHTQAQQFDPYASTVDNPANPAVGSTSQSTSDSSSAPAHLMYNSVYDPYSMASDYYTNQNPSDESEDVEYIPYNHVPPNKKPHQGVPNKSTRVETVHPNPGFLLDPSPLNLPQEDCISKNGEAGYCMSAHDCGYTNGEVNGLCHEGMDSSAHLRVCCIFPSYCGYETNREVTYFKNPDYPKHTKDTGLCLFRVNLLEGVCQLRLDFIEFSLKNKTNGACDRKNRLTVSSPMKRAYVPAETFCGQIEDTKNPVRTDLNHIYIHMDEVPLDTKYMEIPSKKDPYIDFKVRVNDFDSKWNLRISQVMCDGAPLQAPSGCSQYYTSINGTIGSMDIVDRSESSVQMSACIRTDPTTCAIRYNVENLQIGDLAKKKSGRNQLGYGLRCQDYISFNGMKSGICGSAENKEIILAMNGPQGFTYATERGSTKNTDGFSMKYSFIHHCHKRTNYFKYPTAK